MVMLGRDSLQRAQQSSIRYVGEVCQEYRMTVLAVAKSIGFGYVSICVQIRLRCGHFCLPRIFEVAASGTTRSRSA